MAVASAYYNRYGLPLMLTETSVDGKPINREIWLETTIDHIRRLREEGIPMLGLIWWPMIDQLDWDGALTHRIGKIHEVGLFNLTRQKDGTLHRAATPLVKQFRQFAASGEANVGKLEKIVYPASVDDEQLPPIGEWDVPTLVEAKPLAEVTHSGNGHAAGNGASTASAAVWPTRHPALPRPPPKPPSPPAMSRSPAAMKSKWTVQEAPAVTASSSSAICGGALSGSVRSNSSRASPRNIRFCLLRSHFSTSLKASSRN